LVEGEVRELSRCPPEILNQRQETHSNVDPGLKNSRNLVADQQLP
jgi:hypothetical protein